jgi:methylated-DNA-[protein]-cysteine S-methyltransferase
MKPNSMTKANARAILSYHDVDTFYDIVEAPIGPLLVAVEDEKLAYLLLPRDGKVAAIAPGWQRAPSRVAGVRAQLDEYFAGTRIDFELPLGARGTAFQRDVWNALTTIAYGETVSYATLAGRIGRPSAMRAVGAANGANPISIVVPCHRVIGADGTLTGYGGGLPTKQWLLAHERKFAPVPTLRLA